MPGEHGLAAEGDAAILLLGLGDLAVLGNVEVDLGADALAPERGVERGIGAHRLRVVPVGHQPPGVAAIGRIGGGFEIALVVALHRDEAGRVPAGAVEQDPAVQPARADPAPSGQASIAQQIARVVPPAFLPGPVQREGIAGVGPAPAGADPPARVTEARAFHRPDGALRVHRGGRFDHPAEGEVAVEGAGRPVDHPDPGDRRRREHAPVRVPLHVAVDREVDRNAVQNQQHVRGVVGGEPPDHRVGGEARTLPLLVDLDPRGPAHQIVRIGGGRALDLLGADLDGLDRRRRRLRRPGGGHLDRRELGDLRAVAAARCALRLQRRRRQQQRQHRRGRGRLDVCPFTRASLAVVRRRGKPARRQTISPECVVARPGGSGEASGGRGLGEGENVGGCGAARPASRRPAGRGGTSRRSRRAAPGPAGR